MELEPFGHRPGVLDGHVHLRALGAALAQRLARRQRDRPVADRDSGLGAGPHLAHARQAVVARGRVPGRGVPVLAAKVELRDQGEPEAAGLDGVPCQPALPELDRAPLAAAIGEREVRAHQGAVVRTAFVGGGGRHEHPDAAAQPLGRRLRRRLRVHAGAQRQAGRREQRAGARRHAAAYAKVIGRVVGARGMGGRSRMLDRGKRRRSAQGRQGRGMRHGGSLWGG